MFHEGIEKPVSRKSNTHKALFGCDQHFHTLGVRRLPYQSYASAQICNCSSLDATLLYHEGYLVSESSGGHLDIPAKYYFF